MHLKQVIGVRGQSRGIQRRWQGHQAWAWPGKKASRAADSAGFRYAIPLRRQGKVVEGRGRELGNFGSNKFRANSRKPLAGRCPLALEENVPKPGKRPGNSLVRRALLAGVFLGAGQSAFQVFFQLLRA